MQIDEDRNRWGSSLAVAILDQINLVLGCVLAAAFIHPRNEMEKRIREWIKIFKNSANSYVH